MKLAVPLFGVRISPRFDCAQELLLVTIENGKVIQKEKLLWRGIHPHDRVVELTNMGATIVICGAIDVYSHTLLVQKGIKTYSWVTGNAEEAIALFLKGALQPGLIIMQRGRKSQWRCGRRAGWRWGDFHP